MKIREFSNDNGFLEVMYANRDFWRDEFEVENLKMQLEQIRAEIKKLEATAANEYAQARERTQSTSQVNLE